MRRRMLSTRLRWMLALVSALGASGCGSSPITPARIEGAIAPTFTNLVQLQISWLGIPPMTAKELEVLTSCRKTVAGTTGSANGSAPCSGRDRIAVRCAIPTTSS